MKVQEAIDKIDAQIKKLTEDREELVKSLGKEMSFKDKLDFVLNHGKSECWIEHYNSQLIDNCVTLALENGYRNSTFNLKESFVEDLLSCWDYVSLEEYTKVLDLVGEEPNQYAKDFSYSGSVTFEEAKEALEEIVEKGIKEFDLDW